MLDLEADITGLKGAEYNPRRISGEDLDALKASITTLGLVKPLIARKDLLVAGHQRTTALRALGVTKAPVFMLGQDTTVYDEVRFNQLHNGTDLDGDDENVKIAGGFDRPGWHIVEPSRVTGNGRAKMSGVRSSICEMIARYGAWGGVVADLQGNVIHAAQYALAAITLRSPLTTFVVPDDQIDLAKDLLSRQYGVFSYDHLPRNTYIQTMAQMTRLRTGGAKGKPLHSKLYETMVSPYMAEHRDQRMIDFGSGHGDYAQAMRRQGYEIHDVELFRRKSQTVLDVPKIHSMISEMIADLKDRGRYDGVILDSVLNSVDCVEAEGHVMAVINMLIPVGGVAFFSGRTFEGFQYEANNTKTASSRVRRSVSFLDENHFTGILREGVWYFQKFHAKEEVPALAERFGFQIVDHAHDPTESSWQVKAVKVQELPLSEIEKSVVYEFNLPLGKNQFIGRHEDVLEAIRPLYVTKEA